MVLSTEEGRLFSSNSSAGGGHFPEAKLLNHEMPLVAEFSASECYSSGQKPNVVSMDYLFVEAIGVGRPISSEGVHRDMGHASTGTPGDGEGEGQVGGSGDPERRRSRAWQGDLRLR